MTALTENETTFLIDTNILVYAHDKTETKKQAKAIEFIEQQSKSKYFFLSAQNIAEFCSVVTEKIEHRVPILKAKEIASILAETAITCGYSPQTVLHATELQNHHKIHFWDALLAATMLENSIRTIYTENTDDFKKIPGIKTINPLKQKKEKE